MPRTPLPEEPENLERWLVSYADFITLLFAFFVVMYAISSINEGKYRVLSDSLVQAFREAPTSDRLVDLGRRHPELLDGSGRPIGKAQVHHVVAPAETERMKRVARDVWSAMAPLIEEGRVRVTQSARGLTVEINASVLFATGEAVLQPSSIAALTAVARVLAQVDNPIQIEGHTDNVPIRSPHYPSNWELSSARAGSVVRLFAEHGVAPARMVAIGYADNRPIDTNATPEGRARNRRVNILILHERKGEEQELDLAS
ncbi:MAG: flagellar motor protein MotD [Thiobacillaceae bacterium]|nr:flagellar motor protein MotD [Thiobacillaceae bacterium]MDW8323856.1 flagellar motor protein MotD [Burkholderiales bacterium]